MRVYGFSLTHILPYNDRIVDSVLISENTGQWRPVISDILCSEMTRYLFVQTYDYTYYSRNEYHWLSVQFNIMVSLISLKKDKRNKIKQISHVGLCLVTDVWILDLKVFP